MRFGSLTILPDIYYVMIDEMIDTNETLQGLTDQQYDAIQDAVAELALRVYINIDQMTPEITEAVDTLCEVFGIENDTVYDVEETV